MHISPSNVHRDPSTDTDVQRVRTGKLKTGRRMARRGTLIVLVVAAIVVLSVVLGAI